MCVEQKCDILKESVCRALERRFWYVKFICVCRIELQHAKGAGFSLHDVLQHAVQPQHQASGHLH